jgi:predicted AlkP superfamily pyrophosphatase or phosphodiesterase
MFYRYLLVAAFSCCMAVATSVGWAETPAKDRTVILISIDGFPAWMWRDPSLVMPNLKRAIAKGATAEAMTVSNPSITWINHTTLITGVEPRKHGVLYNGLLVRPGEDLPPRVEPWRDRNEMVRVPTLYDATRAAGLTSAEVDWVAVTNPRTIDWSFPELPKADQEIPRELIAAGELTAEQLDWFKSKNSTWRDSVWTKAAIHILKTRKPNLLMYHLLNTDAVNHTSGPGTYASYSAFAYADRLIGDLMAAVEEAGLGDRTTFVLTTDHGFKRVQKVIYPNVALREAGLVRAEGSKVLSCNAYAMAQGGMAFVYVTDPAKRAELLPKLRELCENMEGVAKVLDGSEGPTLGMPTPREHEGMGDLILYAKPGYAFQAAVDRPRVVETSTGYLGTHGYPNSDPELDGVFMAWGRGIRPGVRLKRISNLDVAPTLARLLKVELPEADGKVLTEILAE